MVWEWTPVAYSEESLFLRPAANKANVNFTMQLLREGRVVDASQLGWQNIPREKHLRKCIILDRICFTIASA